MVLDPLAELPHEALPTAVRAAPLQPPPCYMPSGDVAPSEEALTPRKKDWPKLRACLKRRVAKMQAALDALTRADVEQRQAHGFVAPPQYQPDGALYPANVKLNARDLELRRWAISFLKSIASNGQFWMEEDQFAAAKRKAQELLRTAFTIPNSSKDELPTDVWDASFTDVDFSNQTLLFAVRECLSEMWAQAHGFSLNDMAEAAEQIRRTTEEPRDAERIVSSIRYRMEFRGAPAFAWLRDCTLRPPLTAAEQHEFDALLGEDDRRLTLEAAEAALGLNKNGKDRSHRSIRKYCTLAKLNPETLRQRDIPALKRIQATQKRSRGKGARQYNNARLSRRRLS